MVVFSDVVFKNVFENSQESILDSLDQFGQKWVFRNTTVKNQLNNENMMYMNQGRWNYFVEFDPGSIHLKIHFSNLTNI